MAGCLLIETAPDLIEVVTVIADETLDQPTSHVEQRLVADVVADMASGQVKGEGLLLRGRDRSYLGGPPALALSDGAFAPNSHRQAHRGAVGASEGRVHYQDAPLGFLDGKHLMDLVPDSVKGIAPEHVVGGLVFAIPLRHVLPAAFVLQNI